MNQIKNAILHAKKIALFTHINPDGDALGCLCAMHLALKQLGIESVMYCDGEVPVKFLHLACREEVKSGEVEEGFDLFLSMDAASLDRLGKYASAFEKAPSSLQIDHHSTNPNFAKLNYVDATKASCSEIIYDLLCDMHINMNQSIASSLLGGIYTDTGAFCNGNTTQDSLIAASKLVKFVPNLSEMTFHIFKRKTQSEFALFKRAIADSVFELDGQVFLTCIRHNTLIELGASEKDTNAIIGATGMVDGVIINVFICETHTNIYKVSFRSTGNVDVSSVARHLGGGGHKNASGCSLIGQYHTIYSQVIASCQKEISRWKKTV